MWSFLIREMYFISFEFIIDGPLFTICKLQMFAKKYVLDVDVCGQWFITLNQKLEPFFMSVATMKREPLICCRVTQETE